MTDDRSPSTKSHRNAIPLVLTIALFTVFASGCGGGGGGGGGGSSTPPIPATLNGTIDFSAGTPAIGYTVHFGGVSTMTDAHGAFQINFDAGQYPGNQTLNVYDTSNALIDEQTVSVN